MKLEVTGAGALAGISPKAVTAYLRGHGWVPVRVERNFGFFRTEVDGEAIECDIPLRQSTRDYPRRIREVLDNLSLIERRSQYEIYLDLVRTSQDIEGPEGRDERFTTHAARRAYLAADKATLESLLVTLEADSVLERLGLESRLSEVTAELASLDDDAAPGADANSVGREAKDTIMTAGERLIEQGIQQGERALLLRMLRRRFGSDVNAETERRLATASVEQLETWAERVLSAATLTELFAD